MPPKARTAALEVSSARSRSPLAAASPRTVPVRSMAGATAAAAIGYALVAIPLNVERSNNLHDYPVIHNLDLYRYAESVEFLQMLDEANLFTEELDDDA